MQLAIVVVCARREDSDVKRDGCRRRIIVPLSKQRGGVRALKEKCEEKKSEDYEKDPYPHG